MSVAENIHAICKEKGISLRELQEACGLSNSYISSLKSYGSTPSAERLALIAAYLHVSVETLLGEQKKAHVINILGRVAAGIPLDAIENIIGQEELRPDMQGEYFGLKIEGDSMSPEIKDGDIVIVRVQPDAESGDIVVAYVNGYDGVCKKLKKYKDEIQLVSINHEYEPYSSKEEKIQIVGKVVEVRREY